MTASLDDFSSNLVTADTKKKLTVGQDIINYLENPENSIECEDIGAFIDGIVPWMQSSNFKVSQNGLDIVGHLVERLGGGFRPYLNTVLGPAVDRLGDTREIVREKANTVICKLMEETVEPQVLFEKMLPAFSHKNGRVREEILHLFKSTLNSHGSHSLVVSKFLPSIVALLSDPTAPVRDAAVSTLVEIYRHVGERVRVDLQRKYTVPPAKLSNLMAKFDAVRTSGEMMPTATLALGTTTDGTRGEDETDRQSIKSSGSAKSRSSSVPAVRRGPGGFTMPKPPTDGRSSVSSSIRRTPSIRYGSANSGGQAGAVDEESFIQAFEDVKKVTIFTGRALNDELVKIRETLTKTSNDWKVRIEALQMVRSLIVAGAASFDELTGNLKPLEVPFQLSVKDLRSQVVREACITIAFMSQELRHKVDRFLEALFQHIINLIPNSAKVMSTSGIVCVRFIIQNTYSSRLIPIIASNVSSKSRDIRRHSCEFLDHLLHTWPTHYLEKHVSLLSEAIKRGISDADPEARSKARKAYWGFADHFKEQADVLLNSLDGTYRRLLQAGGDMSNSSSSNSLNMAGRPAGGSATATATATATTSTGGVSGTLPRSRQSSITSSQENLLERKTSTLTRKSSGIPMYTSPIKTDGAAAGFSNGSSPRQTPPARSNSAIDPSAARRANVRAQYAQRSRMGLAPGASLPRPRKNSEKGSTPEPGSASRNGRSRSRISSTGGGGVISQSQPGSRSTSPTSLKSYHTYFDSNSPGTVVPTRRRSGIPRSTGPSREASPNRFGTPSSSSSSAKYRSGKASISLAASVERPPKRPLITEKILRQSREAESALADALKNSPRKRSTGGGTGVGGLAFDDGSDESETSSLCSEKSFEYGRRHSDDIGEIIANCASTHWADRKDGLIGLQNYFHDGRMLSGSELRRVTDIFTRMFMDAHTKVFSLFLDTLTELVVSHKADLLDWIYILLTRLIIKLGGDLLGSIIHKIHKTLEIVKESFPYKNQFAAIVRFLVDQTQTPNSKVKVATMNHLYGIAQLMSPSDFPPSSSELDMALAKIITWTYEPKSAEVRKSSQLALTALFNANASQFTSILTTLPKVYQENAAELLQKYLTNNSTSTLTTDGLSGGVDGGGGGPSPMQPRSVQSNRTTPTSNKTNYRNVVDPVDDSENMNPEEIHKSLRSTANAIQNYSFDSGSSPIKDEPTTAAAAASSVYNVEQKLSLLSLSMDLSTPPPNNGNDIQQQNRENLARAEETGTAIKDIIAELQTVKTQTRSAERRVSMTQLIRISREGNTSILQDNFRTVLRLLLENLSDEVGATRALVFGVLTEMLKQEQLISSFQGFTELIILKVLEAHRDEEKDVERAAESCAAAMAAVLPSELVIRVLNPIIKTGDFPMNQAAIKMLTKVTEHETESEVLANHLSEIMPGLLKAYDNIESSVRKASVFCMVALHQRVGAKLQPHLEGLNGSKLKLLNLYIKRAQPQSTPGSPRLSPP